MVKKSIYKDFAIRLINAMKQAGYSDNRSHSGICVKTLSKFSNASEQICRRYLRGDALPDYERVVRVSRALQVAPGWLLFGGVEGFSLDSKNIICIHHDLLYYILSKTHALYQLEFVDATDFPDFVLSLVKDISAIDTGQENLKKIIDIAVSSICSFESIKMKQTS